MRVPRISLLAAAIASIGTATLAADFPPPLPAPVVPVEFGWYLRGDVGVGQLHASQLEYIPTRKMQVPISQSSTVRSAIRPLSGSGSATLGTAGCGSM